MGTRIALCADTVYNTVHVSSGTWGSSRSNISDNSDRSLEKCIREKFVPAIIGRNVSDLHRRMLALPVRLGGGAWYC